ncbi:MAG: cytochrome c-type biogenesis protein CcmH [Actinomycetes bacterium]
MARSQRSMRVSALGVGLLLLATLIFGSGALSSAPLSRADHIAVVEAGIRCPACEGLSVAQSNAPSAIAVRHQIEAWVKDGISDQMIKDRLVAQFGASVLLAPPKSGLSLWLWILPIALALGVAVIFVFLVIKRKRS